ncbi:MAG: ShlB/FhaC/HecB family hemolysin secretion/activation protein [Campylobacteraceae bacterium]|jgi:hemolysin activation/secretion protein|nr:ShlB/FhaC/HecB family hemolysin secretion/activation protein [Campylobacteraceae bacterium]
MQIDKVSIRTICCLALCAAISNADIFDEVEQRNRQRDIFESLSKDPTKNVENFEVPEVTPSKPNEDEKCFYIRNIVVLDATLLNKSHINEVTSKYLNKCDSLSDLKNLTNEINSLYIDKGYITSQVYLSSQNIAKGDLTFQAVEGRVNNIDPQKLYVANAFIGQKNDHLNIRDVESAIENINRLPSNHATMKLNPSEKVGYTDIVVENSPTRRFGGSIGVDNYGSEKTGKAQVNSRLNFDNVIGINDQANVFFNFSNRYFEDENSKGNGYDYSFPVGKTTITFSQRNNRFEQKVRSGNSVFLSQGATKTYTFDTQYKLYHDQKNRINIGASVANYKTRNYFGYIYLESSSYRLSKLTLSADYLYQIPGFYTFINFAYVRGVDLFQNYHSTELNDEYEIYNISLSAMKDFYLFRYSLSAYIQFTDDSLFGSDKISIGGPYSIRGFGKEGLSGNEGYYIRNELSYNAHYEIFGGISNSYFVALDGGEINSDEDSFGGRLIGYSFGTKLQSKNLEASLHYDMPLYKKDVNKAEKFFGASFRIRF